MFTARGKVDNKIQDLKAGADHSIAKSFSPRELMDCLKAKSTPIAVTELLTAIRQDALLLSGQQQIILGSDEQLYLNGCINELPSAFSNLVFSAVKYTRPGSTIVLRCYRDQEDTYFQMKGNGPRIDSKLLDFLTQHFYRVDGSRSSQTGGTGLGLATVKHVMLRHQGRLNISSSAAQGSYFTCQFPLTQIV